MKLNRTKQRNYSPGGYHGSNIIFKLFGFKKGQRKRDNRYLNTIFLCQMT